MSVKKTGFAFFLLALMLVSAAFCSDCHVIYSEKNIQKIKSVAVFPVCIGFSTAHSLELIPFVKIPSVLDDMSKVSGIYREMKMLIDRDGAERIRHITDSHLYDALLESGRYLRVIHPDAVKNILAKNNLDSDSFRCLDDFCAPGTADKLYMMSNIMGVDGIIIGIIKRCETFVIDSYTLIPGRNNFGNYTTSMRYSYKFEMEIGLFEKSSRKIVWIGECKESKSSLTPDYEQNILIALASNKMDKFALRFFRDKILKKDIEYQCVKKIADLLPY